MKRREYNLQLVINDRHLNKVIIDPHYQLKHSESINDEIILELVQKLDGNFFEPDAIAFPYLYFVTDQIERKGKLYKLIWLLEEDQLYIGIVNAYRR